ncbi:MAG: 4Fe-4S binding protein [Candidatus Thorarchaeota archaeon]
MPRKAIAIEIDPVLCKGCHICIAVCPHDVLRASDRVDNRGYYLASVHNLGSCRVCRLCEMSCPDFAICVVEETSESIDDSQGESVTSH